MRQIQRQAPLLLCLAALLAGCASAPILPGQDKFVVLSERELANAVTSMEQVWQFDHDNLAFMKAQLPQVHAVIQESRKHFWEYYDPAVAALRAYKQSKLPEDQAAAEDMLVKVRNIVHAARQALTQAQTAARSARPSG